MSTARRKQALILFGIATVAFTVILGVIDPSHVSHGPTILNFEFAGSRSRATQIVAEWGPKGRSAAHLSLFLGYGYMLSYGLFFALAGFAVRDTARARSWPRLAAIGTVVPFFALAAAGFDASENVALLLTLAGNGGSFAPPFAAVCSAIKFSLITIAILYALCGLALRLRARLLQPSRSAYAVTIDRRAATQRNIELKARDPDPAASLEVCRRLGAEDRGEIAQRDTYFAVPRGGLKLREEQPGHPHLVQFERANEPQQRESRYRIIEVSDGEALCVVLAATIGIRGVVVKRRRLLLWRNVRIHLDEVEQLGTFIELEAVALPDSDLTTEHRLVGELRGALGITDERLVALGYAEQLIRTDGNVGAG